jgi:hypothetical protein
MDDTFFAFAHAVFHLVLLLVVHGRRNDYRVKSRGNAKRPPVQASKSLKL